MQEYGGFWIRVGAYLIDYIIVQIASTFVSAILIAVFAAAGSSDDAMGVMVILVYLLIFVADWLYHALLESSSWQATVGKRGVGLVVGNQFGERISFGRATGRYFAKLISTLILLFGYFMIGWTQRKQGLHDMMAGTFVYKARSPNEVVTSARVFE